MKLKPSGHQVAKTQITYLPLNYDRKCVSWNEFSKEGDFESGYSYAADYNRIYFLAASTEGDNAGTFRIGKTETEIVVPCYTGFIGQWGHTEHTEGYLKEAEIAYVGTHRHAPEGDQAYEYTYMFKFGMDIPQGATSLILPKNKQIILFAATLVQENNIPVCAASELFRTALNPRSVSAQQVQKENLLKNATVIAYSGYINEKEAPKYMIDGNNETKR